MDVVYYGDQHRLEYDFIVQPGADPKIIAMSFEGPDKVQIDKNVDLILNLTGKETSKEIRQNKPVVFQEIAGGRRSVAGAYAMRGPNQVGFEVGEYDTTRPLVIDPPLIYSSYLGSTGKDQAFGIAVDSQGNAIVTGKTLSTDFPTKPSGTFNSIVPPDCPGAPGTRGGTQFFDECFEPHDVFVTKFKADGSDILYSTLLGGNRDDRGMGIDIDSAGNAYVTGWTLSSNFPVKNAVQPNFASTSIQGMNDESDAGNFDAFSPSST